MTMSGREPGRQSPTRKWTLRTSFIGPQGIRSGWSMLIFLAIVIAELLVTRVPVNHLLRYMNYKQSLQSWTTVVAVGIPALLVFIATAILARIEKRPAALIRIHGRTEAVAIRSGYRGRHCGALCLGSGAEGEWVTDL